MPFGTLTSKGQITLPKEIREQLKLKPGDRMEFLVGPNGGITILPVTSDVTILKGLIPQPKQPVTLEDMRPISQRGGRLRRPLLRRVNQDERASTFFGL
jgi:AbrB family looped-hinge helix DNA binding protein